METSASFLKVTQRNPRMTQGCRWPSNGALQQLIPNKEADVISYLRFPDALLTYWQSAIIVELRFFVTASLLKSRWPPPIILIFSLLSFKLDIRNISSSRGRQFRSLSRLWTNRMLYFHLPEYVLHHQIVSRRALIIPASNMLRA